MKTIATTYRTTWKVETGWEVLDEIEKVHAQLSILMPLYTAGTPPVAKYTYRTARTVVVRPGRPRTTDGNPTHRRSEVGSEFHDGISGRGKDPTGPRRVG